MQSIDAALFMFAPLMALLFLGVPVAFALITVAAVFGLWHFGDSPTSIPLIDPYSFRLLTEIHFGHRPISISVIDQYPFRASTYIHFGH